MFQRAMILSERSGSMKFRDPPLRPTRMLVELSLPRMCVIPSRGQSSVFSRILKISMKCIYRISLGLIG